MQPHLCHPFPTSPFSGNHLIENLLMEKEDIETLPIFTREGISWAKLNRTFDGKLETIIHEINEAIAA